MKLPLWIYDDKLKKYVVFPYHLLKTFEDGKLGLDWPVLVNKTRGDTQDMFTKYRQKFYRDFAGPNQTPIRYLLKEDPNDQRD